MEPIKDHFEQRLQDNLALLKQCQNNKGVDSCLKCQETLQCELRQDYVKSVYESMSKGNDGDFEF